MQSELSPATDVTPRRLLVAMGRNLTHALRQTILLPKRYSQRASRTSRRSPSLHQCSLRKVAEYFSQFGVKRFTRASENLGHDFVSCLMRDAYLLSSPD
jgi:hypothetical protein